MCTPCHSEPVTDVTGVGIRFFFVRTKVRIAAPVCTPRVLASRRALVRNDTARNCYIALPYEKQNTPPYILHFSLPRSIIIIY